EPADPLCPKLLIQMHERLGVAVSLKLVTALLERFTDLPKVVDFTVEHNPHGLVFVVNGLMASLHIDDREPPHPQANCAIHIEAIVVGASVTNRSIHGLQP